MIGISIRQLEVFVAIADTGTVLAASERLSVTQPAVSMALSELERQIGAPLFDRVRRRLRLSARGRELLPCAQEVIERMHEMLREPGAHPQALTGKLHLGASNTIGNYLVGELLGEFVHRHPGVSLKVSVENTGTIVAGILEHRIDVGCVEGPVNDPQIDTIGWRHDDLLVCAAPGHPLTRHRALQARHFQGASWILREPGSAMRVQAERVLASLPSGRILLELGQVEAIKQAVIAGLGIACLPGAATTDAVATGRLVALDTPFLDLQRRLSLLLHRARYRGALIDAFVRSVLDKPEPESP